jgi:hypothetical protein
VKALARAATEAGLVCTGLHEEPKKAPKEAAPPKAEKTKGKKPEKAPA